MCVGNFQFFIPILDFNDPEQDGFKNIVGKGDRNHYLY